MNLYRDASESRKATKGKGLGNEVRERDGRVIQTKSTRDILDSEQTGNVKKRKEAAVTEHSDL